MHTLKLGASTWTVPLGHGPLRSGVDDEDAQPDSVANAHHASPHVRAGIGRPPLQFSARGTHLRLCFVPSDDIKLLPLLHVLAEGGDGLRWIQPLEAELARIGVGHVKQHNHVVVSQVF